MMRQGIISLVAGLLVVFTGQPGLRAEAKAEAPDFKEVYDSIREHLGGVTDAELNRAAVQALVNALAPKVSLVENGSNPPANGPLVTKASLYDGNIAYLRIGRVNDGLTKAVADAIEKLGSTNKLKGVALDLRYTGGDDYAVAAATADLFVKKEQPLLDWGNGVARSRQKQEVIDLPVAVLVNRQTSGAAEALAAVLRETGAGLILGSNTAGQAMIAQEFPLKNGERLRIATTPIRLGDGTALSASGLKPDITVEVSPEDERAYYSDAFTEIPRSDFLASASLSLTNLPNGANRATRRARFNEAELVRERRDGLNLDADGSSRREAESERPVVHDPALARALDLLKGLAVVRQSRS
jgi:C-terminal processing protease CtpA/Prc